MSEFKTLTGSSVVAVYADHSAAENAVRRLHKNGFALDEISIVGRNLEVSEEPVGFVSTGDYVSAARANRGFGRWAGGCGTGSGASACAGHRSDYCGRAARSGGACRYRGAVAGVALGAIGGALIGLGVPKEHAIKYETEVKGGKYLVIVRGRADDITKARNLLANDGAEHVAVHDPITV